MRCPECKAPVIGDEWDMTCSEDVTHEILEPEDSPWFIHTDSMAEWALSKMAVAENNLDRIIEHAEDMKRRADEFVERESKRYRRDADFFRQHLAAYYDRVAPTLGKSKTYPLVNGEITSRAGSEVVELVDQWAEEAMRAGLGEYVRTSYAPDKRAIKAALKKGEEIPGAHLVKKPDEVIVKPSRDEHPAYLPMPRDDESEAA